MVIVLCGFKKHYEDFESFKFSFYELFSQTSEDIKTLKSLFLSYQATLNLDAINSISNMMCVRQNIQNLKEKFSVKTLSLVDTKLYLFYVQFFLDMSYKINFLFKTYFENKKNNLMQSIQNSNFINDFKLKENLFSFNSEKYCDEYMKKLGPSFCPKFA